MTTVQGHPTTIALHLNIPASAVVAEPLPELAMPDSASEAGASSADSLPPTAKMTVNVRRDLIDEAKDAFWLARGEYRTFAAWVEDALRKQIADTKRAHGVSVLPARPGPLPPGRPLS